MGIQNNTQSRPMAVVLGLSPTGLYAIRELGRNGIRVIGVSDSRNAAAASRYAEQIIIESDPARRLGRLLSLENTTPKKAVLIPTSDQDIEFIMAHAKELQKTFVFQSSYADGTADVILTKQTFYERCRDYGVSYPLLRDGTASDLAAIAAQINYPCMVKPSRIHEIKSQMAGRKGWIVRDQSELLTTLKNIPKNAGMLLCQEIVPGPESEITLFCAYFDGKGGIHQPFTARKLRQYPPGFGSASIVQSSDEADSRRIASDLLIAMEYEGIAAAEFKRDPVSGTLKIIEINPRPSLWFSVAEASGKQVTLAAYNALCGLGPMPAEQPQRNGVRWRYRGKDMYSAAFYAIKKNFILPPPDVSAVGASTARVGPLLCKDDPRPAFSEVAILVRKGLKRIVGKFRGKG